MAFLLGVLWATSLVFFMFGHIIGIEVYSPNLVLVSFLFLFTINPLRICYYRARFWLLRVLVSFVLVTGLGQVVQRVDNVIQRKSRYPADEVSLVGVHFIRWIAIYPLD